MLTVQKLLFLRRVGLLSRLSSRELGHVASIAEEVVFPEGTAIFNAGDPGDAMYLIVDGEVRIHIGDREINRLKQSDYFGDMAILDGSERSASAQALTDCLMLRISQGDFHGILAANFDAVRAIVHTLCQRIRAAEDRERAALKKLAQLGGGEQP